MQPIAPAARRPAWLRLVLYLGVVIVLAVLLWFTWNYLQGEQRWTYGQLIVAAQDHQVRELVITGHQGVATDVHGVRHGVTLPGDPATTADLLAGEGVNVVYEEQSGDFWLSVVIPNLFLVIIAGSLLVAAVWATRMTRIRR